MFYRASPVSEIIDHFIGTNFVDSFLQTFGLWPTIFLLFESYLDTQFPIFTG